MNLSSLISRRAWLAPIILPVVSVLVFGLFLSGSAEPATTLALPTSSVPTAGPAATPTIPPPTPTGNAHLASLKGYIAFTCTRDGYNHICRLDPTTGEIVQLTEGKWNDYYPAPGGDGYIYFASQRTLPFRLYRVPAQGGSPEPVAADAPGEHSAPDLSPDGQWLVFTSDLESGQKFLYLIRPDGSDLRPLLTSGSNVDPTWSPDGRMVAFAALTTNSDGVQLFVIDLINGTIEQKTSGVRGIGGHSAWSPDGRALVFYAGGKGDKDIYLFELESSMLVQLTDGGNNTAPSWSPDGEWIVFSSSRDGDFELYIIRPDGSMLTQLTSNVGLDDWQPKWGR